MPKKIIHLLSIDAQNDFCDPKGALFVPGAKEDTERLASLVTRLSERIDAISLTLDSHHARHIAHAMAWRNDKGEHPTPFSIITVDDVKKGVWKASVPNHTKWQREYVETLDKNGRYPLCIWPDHCLIGSWGQSLVPAFHDAVVQWEKDTLRIANKVTKGSNILTEHYSAVQADVQIPSDPGTQLNTSLIDRLQEADDILITGQALSHCVANTIRDIADNFGDDNVKKFILLEDTSSNVPTFDKMGEDFVEDMKGRGMRIAKSTDYLV